MRHYTSNIETPASLNALLEQLGENTQEVWATQRIEDAWRYCPKRDDANKQHPYLLRYKELPESEMELERRVAADKLKAVMVQVCSVEAQ